MNQKKRVKLSKFLSYILRHNPRSINLTLDAGGWCSIKSIIRAAQSKSRCFTAEDIFEVVTTNDKQRFALNADKTKIRANQGHSLPVDLGLTSQKPPDFLFHGTAEKYLDSIRERGLITKKRRFVHLSTDYETAVKVGRRHGKPIVLRIDAGKMHRDDFRFYLSENGIWLVSAVPETYFEILKKSE